MKHLPETFLILNHEGLHKVTCSIDPVQSMDHLLAKFSSEKLILAKNISEHPFGILHEAIWTSEPMRTMSILELTRGIMVLETQYKGYTSKEPELNWVSPCFVKTEGSFPLRCGFEFEKWTQAGLRMFLALNHSTHQAHFWVYYQGQIYHLPFGNIFEGTEQICLGHNIRQHSDIFAIPEQTRSSSFAKLMMLLSASVWNHDAFNSSRCIGILSSLVRFNSASDQTDLPMMPPKDPDLIKKSVVASSRELVQITTKIIPPIIQS